MPAEWERHEATWLSWPVNDVTWPGAKLKEVEEIYARMIGELLAGEKVNLLVPDDAHAKKALSLLPRKAQTQRLIFHEVKYVDSWIRDYGPIFVRDGKRKLFTKWRFNAWGGKYADLARDNAVPDRIAALKNYRRVDPGIILEGGSIDTNGRGVCLTTEQCLLNKKRNSRLSATDIERYLKNYLGFQKIIWLKEGIEGDDTDGHVDDITRFTDARTIVTALESNTLDNNHFVLSENLEILKSATDLTGKKFRIVELPMPGVVSPARKDTPQHQRLPASYANFYIGNAAVLVPVYSHRNDKSALGIIKRCFPNRRVVGIECTPLVYGMGSIHCVTQQEPL